MPIEKLLNVILLVIYLAAVVFAVFAMTYAALRDRRLQRLFRASILDKLVNGIELSAQEARTIAKGVALPQASVNRSVYRLLHDTSDPALYEKLKRLSLQLEKEEPFDDLPDEVKPSLLRLMEICEASPNRSDQALLSPIQKSLSSFVELRAQTDKTQRFSRWVNIVGIASFAIGIWGVYLSWKSPSVKDVEAAVARSLRQSALPPDAPAPSSLPSAR